MASIHFLNDNCVFEAPFIERSTSCLSASLVPASVLTVHDGTQSGPSFGKLVTSGAVKIWIFIGVPGGNRVLSSTRTIGKLVLAFVDTNSKMMFAGLYVAQLTVFTSFDVFIRWRDLRVVCRPYM